MENIRVHHNDELSQLIRSNIRQMYYIGMNKRILFSLLMDSANIQFCMNKTKLYLVITYT